MPDPVLYEINTRCWLRDLSKAHARAVTLASVPDSEVSSWKHNGFTHIWLMGVWSGGPRALQQALAGAHQSYSQALPDWREEDIGPSPYAIADYTVPPALGGEAGLKCFRNQLHSQGLKLILDFVPNHLGIDHPWVLEHPDVFVQSPHPVPETFRPTTNTGDRWFAHGKDPYFAAWVDTVQLDYRRPATHRLMTGLLLNIAARCDGVRCDMAMLPLNDVFAKTWEKFPPSGRVAVDEFWQSAIMETRKLNPNFLFLAEVYWGLEQRLQDLGFDYTYDKELLDLLLARNGAAVQSHLLTMPPRRLAASAHFLENHDEARIASRLELTEHRAAALLVLALPGMRFLHEGQLVGARIRAPVQLLRRPVEPPQHEIEKMYRQLFDALSRSAVGKGNARLLVPSRTETNQATAANLVAIQWQASGPEFDLVVINLGPSRAIGNVRPAIPELGVGTWAATDLLGQEQYSKQGLELRARGLHLDLPAHATHLFHFKPESWP